MTLEDIPRCFYVGKGSKKRPDVMKGRNQKHRNVVNKHGVRVEICIGPVTHDEAVLWEIEQIKVEGTYHYDDPDGIGCNFTLGGEGTPGSHHNLGRPKPPFSKEHRQAISSARANQDMSKHSKAMKNLAWIHNVQFDQRRRVPKDQVDRWIDEGWNRGRK